MKEKIAGLTPNQARAIFNGRNLKKPHSKRAKAQGRSQKR